MKECRICPGPRCDQEFHGASDRVRAHLRHKIESYLMEVKPGEKKSKPCKISPYGKPPAKDRARLTP